ncbi:hypothetical protein [Micromonospora cathayae]|uniref:Uncharacterized protein n=1 Tax=Micromonospora cathayae TaxID=3028804 RepID=A0ABY7ZRS8_9ACTN|nr:hypothetical protein [Micromonospora sp. HUAS 3]WDZ84912.1 hypothetical protein PVK37_00060 [Micromonospora sp. HUAS 3]
MASLASAIYSYRLSRQAHHVSTYYGAIGLFRELDKTFVEYPETRPYIYDGKPVDPDDPDYHRVRAVAELVLDAFEWIWYRQRSLNAEGEWGWRAYIIDTFTSSPALQQHYASAASWYPGITRLIADRSLDGAFPTPRRPGGGGPKAAGRPFPRFSPGAPRGRGHLRPGASPAGERTDVRRDPHSSDPAGRFP